MAHGIIVKNNLGETVLDNDTDLLCQTGTGVATGSAYHNSGAYLHNVTLAPAEFIAWQMTNGRWIAETLAFNDLENWGNGDLNNPKLGNVSYRMISNAQSVGYRKLKFGSDIPATGRWGLAVRKLDGSTNTFHSDMTLAWMGEGRVVTLAKPSFNAASYALSPSPEWAVASGCASGFSIDLGDLANNPDGNTRVSRQRIIGAIRRSGSALVIESRTLSFGGSQMATYTPDKNITVSLGVLRT